MKIRFTLNITQVQSPDDDVIDTEDRHYPLALAAFVENFDNVDIELLPSEGGAIYVELQDIEEIKG